MSGQPAARKGDRVAKGKIAQGSRTVLIGSQGGIACSECPGGITVSSPVNPQIGAKVLLGEEDLDFALPGALPVVWQRRYSSYVNASHGAACGLLGYGWHLWLELSVALQEEATLLFDANGRVITFDEPLPPGGQLYSASEGLWLLRGGGGSDREGTAPWASDARWRHVAPTLARSANTILATSGNGDTLWHLAMVPSQRSADDAADRWRLVAVTDRLGRSQHYQYSDGSQRDTDLRPLPLGMLVGLSDGTGRRYRLQHQRIHKGKKTRDRHALWGVDDGLRLATVELVEDPIAPLRGTIALAHYGYSDDGDLLTVHNRAKVLVRSFEWDYHRISAHRIAQGPWHGYRYESSTPGARVIEHYNQDGLQYRFDYLVLPDSPQGLPRASTRVSDSLGRVETYYFEGAPGLSRLVAHDKADGSRWLQAYDAFGRLTCSTDPLARSTYLRRDGQGRITGTQLPGGRSTQQHYDEASGRLLHSTDAAGACTRYQYDAWGRLAQTTWADGSHERYHYPNPTESPLIADKPLRIEDAHGATKHLDWDGAGQLLSYTDCSGRSTRYSYDRYGALEETTNASGEWERYQRDSQGRLVATERVGPSVERYHYNDAGHLVRIEPAWDASSRPGPGQTDLTAHHIHLSYDLWGRLLQRSQGGRSISLEYDSAGRLTRLVNENGAQSCFAWDTQDRLVQEEGFDQRLQRYRWDAAGQLLTSTDGNAKYQHTTRYAWDSSARLSQRHIPASAHAPAQTHHYQWNAAGQLVGASVWLHPASAADAAQALPAQLQSQISLQRDALGRITGEVQKLYATGGSDADPASATPEFEHHISHGLDALGNRLHSELQGLGTIAWQLYGAGHVHGLQHNGHTLVDIERDAQHRETRRSLGSPGPADKPANSPSPLQILRKWDHLGRVFSTATQGLQLPAAANPAAPPLALQLVGQIANRRYRHDTLGQITTIEQGVGEQASQVLRYAYDAAGRLLASAEGLRPTNVREWRTDPAGNRLPGPAPTAANPGSDAQQWTAQVHAHWREESFNLLGLDHRGAYQRGPVKQWDDNRIGYSTDCVWRYDEFGRRIEQLQSLAPNAQGQPQRSRQELRYDGDHQLLEVHCTYSNGRPEQHLRYTYDALGRRLCKKSSTAAGEHTSYYGWDGERLIHTEHLRPGPDGPDAQPCRHIEHTIYESGSFTPLVRLSTTTQLSEHQQPPLLLRALQAGMADADSSRGESGGEGNDKADDSTTQALALMQSMLSAMPASMQAQAEQNMQQALHSSTTMPAASALMGDTAQRGGQLLQDMRDQLQQQQQKAHNRIATHYYHCDHLGTPLALTDTNGQIVWAATLDPWGNLLDEYDPHGIGQPIRLPGQIHDRETGLYYNRHRYYDPQVGGYITQDPIGLEGGTNKSRYPLNPMMWVDPLGLDPTQPPARGPDLGKTKGWWDKAQDALSWRENIEKGREVKKDQDILMCKAEKEIAERVENDQLTPEAAKLALAAKKTSIYAAGPAAAGVENFQSDWITKSPILYGYFTAPNKNCVNLLQTNQPTFDFFK